MGYEKPWTAGIFRLCETRPMSNRDLEVRYLDRHVVATARKAVAITKTTYPPSRSSRQAAIANKRIVRNDIMGRMNIVVTDSPSNNFFLFRVMGACFVLGVDCHIDAVLLPVAIGVVEYSSPTYTEKSYSIYISV